MKFIKADKIQSFFAQSLATVALFCELDRRNFLDSDYYKNIEFPDNDDQFKYILNESGIGNPGSLQMFLYVLLVVPKEMLESKSPQYFQKVKSSFNILSQTIIERLYTKTTYKNENNYTDIDFYRHVRNAISHARCYYITIDNVNYVKFCDVGRNQETCDIVIKTENIGIMVDFLFEQMLFYLKLRQNGECMI